MPYAFAIAPFVEKPQVLFTLAAVSTFRMDGDTERAAYKFYAQTTSPITHVDLWLDINGTVTGINFQLAIHNDNSDVPGTVLGAATVAFAGPATDGFIGENALASNTGTLTINAPYWIVLTRASGVSLSASVWVQLARVRAGVAVNREKLRHFNGSDWTTTTAQSTEGAAIVKHADGSYSGNPVSASGSIAASTADDINGTARQGLRFKSGSTIILKGVQLSLVKTGSPSALVIEVYEATTLKHSQTIAAADISTTIGFTVWFDSGITLAKDTNLYLVLKQAANGGDASNDYDVLGWPISATYISALCPPDWRFVHGTGDDPTALTVSATEFPCIFPILTDPATDLDEASSGGGLLRHPGMSGGLNG